MIFEIVAIIVIMFSIILHEVAHGYSAYVLGDTTAKDQGRLTLNPVPHVDILGTIIIPASLLILGTGFVFGWAKPVPYNPYNLRHRLGEAIVAAAGPGMNIAIAIAIAMIFRLTFGMVPEAISSLLYLVVFVNLFLALLNLIPIPPLDGAKIVSALMPVKYRLMLEGRVASIMNVNSIAFTVLVLLFIIFFLFDYLIAAVHLLTVFLTGTSI